MIEYRLITKWACFAVLLLFGFALQAQAQQNSVGVAPASVEAKVKRGSTQTQTYTLFNHTSERLRFSCSVIDYWYDESNKRLTGRAGTLPRSASLWVQFSPSEIIVEPHGSATVKATISVPVTAAGGYYTMPVFEATPVRNDASPISPATDITSASISIRFRGVMMLVTEDGSEYHIEIAGGKVTPPTSSTPLEIDMDVRNRGIVHARLRGVFAILDERGTLAGRGKLEDKKLLPGQRNTLKVPWTGELQPGRYTAVVALSYDRVGLEPNTLTYELPFTVGQPPTVAQGR